jgi:hypothetical protein
MKDSLSAILCAWKLRIQVFYSLCLFTYFLTVFGNFVRGSRNTLYIYILLIKWILVYLLTDISSIKFCPIVYFFSVFMTMMININ